MKKYLRVYAKDYTFLNSISLYNKSIYNQFKSLETIQTTTIYAIIKTKKIFIDISSMKIDMYYNISFNIYKDFEKKTFKFNLLEMYFDNFCNQFKSIDILRQYAEEEIVNIEELKQVGLKKENIISLLQVVPDSIDDSQFILRCPFFYVLSNKEMTEVTFCIYKLLNWKNFDFIDDLEIMYIGQSMDDTVKRLKNHNKWGKISALDRQNEEKNDFLIYVFNLDKADTDILQIDNKNLLIINNESALDLKKAVSLFEVALISHYKPELNEKNLDTNLEKYKPIKKIFSDQGYTDITIEMNFEDAGVMGNIKTKNVEKQKIEISLSA